MLRERAGLSQEAVAAVLGPEGSGGRSYISQVERGYLKSGPGFVRLLDYLRACGCGIGSVLDILNRHTSKPPVAKEQASRAVLEAIADMPEQLHRRAHYYHVGLTHKTGEPAPSAAVAAKRIRHGSGWQGGGLQFKSRMRRLPLIRRGCKRCAGARLRAQLCNLYGLQTVGRAFGPICLWLVALGLRLLTEPPT